MLDAFLYAFSFLLASSIAAVAEDGFLRRVLQWTLSEMQFLYLFLVSLSTILVCILFCAGFGRFWFAWIYAMWSPFNYFST